MKYQISEKKVKQLIEELKHINSFKESTYYKNLANWSNAKQSVINSENLSEDVVKEFLNEYQRVSSRKRKINNIETDDRAITNVERDENGLIQYYTFEIFRKDSPTLAGKLDRKEMETIYRLYSIYGSNLTSKIVSREFPQYTFVEFKRILHAFNIYKASSPFPQHYLEEKSEEELLNLHNQQKENNVLRRIEKDQLSEANKLNNKLAKENQDLKKFIDSINNISINLKGFTPSHVNLDEIDYFTEQSLVLHLSDMHIGSRCSSTCIYPNEWNREELTRRLNVILNNIPKFGVFDTIVLNMLGDNLDGMDNQTARRDHFMPQNMDNMEQVTTFIEVMIPFIDKLRQFAYHIKIYSVDMGNHDGIMGYVASLALKNIIEKTFTDIQFTLFNEFIGSYEFNSHTYILCHGKDSAFMKKPLPLNLDEKTKVMIYEWMESKGVKGGQGNVHFIKGDLHSNALSSCNLFDYRNVLSLYGSSDYSAYNYSRNAYGISYDLFIGENRTIGTFENL